MISQSTLFTLTGGRWHLPLLAAISRQGERSAVLLARLGLSRSMLKRSLAALVEGGWVTANPGHGHPLRPEWKLTDKGLSTLPGLQALMDAAAACGLNPDSAGRWHLPLLAALAGKELPFSTLESQLSPISPRALSQALKRAIALGHVDRRIEAGFPPTPLYRVNDKARPLADEAKGLSDD